MTDILQIIVRNITKNYIFYIPSSVRQIIEVSGFKDLIAKDQYDSIMYYDRMGKYMTAGLEHLVLIEIMTKESLLRKNLVMLLDAKSTHNDIAFSIILEDYQKQIGYHQFVTTWMFNNITKIFPDIDDVFLGVFKIQADCFDTHYSELLNYFQLKNKVVTIKNNDVLEHLEVTFSEQNSSPKLTPSNEASALERPTLSSKEDSATISDETIDLFLLQSVFNVQL